ncbi:MAG: 1-(5-phosphoribosyl)-5-[(5-phosphoribosylamino)methylideneamino]imidazole-4-carboxamide isomerase [Planctomycetes bacterium]|nr:1-(5-phosphoribosyl)-5-[(5-phosphoribosylamino)methylideneamino]imidazole-4-carboxamide isomerase [Planctomycetota bacterium]
MEEVRLAPTIYPAIDIRGGRCVRLVEGDFARETAYQRSPTEQARAWEAEGASWVHVVDLDGAREGKPGNRDLILKIASAVRVPVQVGGGIRDFETAKVYLESGVRRVVLGTLAAKKPEEARDLARAFPERVVLGLDLKGSRVATEGWTKTSLVDPEEILASFRGSGFAAAIVTDIGRDGKLLGPSLGLYRRLVPASPLALIASGGVSSVADVESLAAAGVAGIVVGKALYEGRIRLADAIHAAGNARLSEGTGPL